MITKKVFKSVPRAHLLAISTAGLLMGTGMMLNASAPTSSDKKEITLALAERPDAFSVNNRPVDLAPVDAPLAATIENGEAETTDLASDLNPQEGTTNAISATETHQTQWKRYTVRSGDTLSSLFSKAGLTNTLLYKMDSQLKGTRWSQIHPGEELAFGFDADGQLVKLTQQKDLLTTWLIEKEQDRFTFSKEVKETENTTAYAQGTIDAVFYTAAQDAGLDDRLTMELANLFAWDVDFALDIRKGDSFKVIYEDVYLDGKKIGTGNILAAEFTNQGRTHSAIRHIDAQGVARYYDQHGGSVRKAFLRSPIDFARISSHFNPRRKHPVLHTIRAHRGTDYAASRGTPIKATGDAKVTFAGRKGGYGNVVILQHGQSITTLYAHMKGFARGIRSGKRVRQGQVIGYVGATGLASGPHLHYEFRVNGIHKNPVTVKLPNASPIPKAERASFEQETQRLMAQIATYSDAFQLAYKDEKKSRTAY